MKKPKQSLLLVLGQQIVDKIPENLNEQILRKAETLIRQKIRRHVS